MQWSDLVEFFFFIFTLFIIIFDKKKRSSLVINKTIFCELAITRLLKKYYAINMLGKFETFLLSKLYLPFMGTE